jgi:hypothetical protein
MTDVGWYSQYISLNSINLVKFYICKPKSTGRGSLIKKQTITQIFHLSSGAPLTFFLGTIFVGNVGRRP